MNEEYPPYNPFWYDDGRTCDPCPNCNQPLYWSQFYSFEHRKSMRHLICKNKKKCKYSSKKVEASNVRMVHEREWLNGRMG